MKIISAITGTPSMSKEEVDIFLENKLNLQFGIIDAQGDPNIGPVWFNYDKNREKLFNTYTQNVQEDPQYTQEGYYLLLYRRWEFSI